MITPTSSGLQLILATNNPNKRRELEALLSPLGYKLETLDQYPQVIPFEESGHTFEENAIGKAARVAIATGAIAIADDSGLVVPALHGEPGIHSARYSGPRATDASNRLKLLGSLRSMPEELRVAHFVCVIAVVIPNQGGFFFRGECQGRILREERGTGGFGYDPLFWIDAHQKTMAEISSELKNEISHRAIALKRSQIWLQFLVDSLVAGRI